MSFSGTASQIVAAFAANFDPSRLGEDHVVRCGRALADTMAVAIAAQNEAVVRRACDYVETLTPCGDVDNNRRWRALHFSMVSQHTPLTSMMRPHR
jgi:hypothetical protein